MKWANILFTCDTAKIRTGGSKPYPDFLFFVFQVTRKNDVSYYVFRYIFLK